MGSTSYSFCWLRDQTKKSDQDANIGGLPLDVVYRRACASSKDPLEGSRVVTVYR